MWTRCLSLTLAAFALACTTEKGDTDTDGSSSVGPTTDPATDPSTDPTTVPSDPSTVPSTDPGTDPSTDPPTTVPPTTDTPTTTTPLPSTDTGTEDTGTEDTGTEDTGTEDTGTEDTNQTGLSFAVDVYEPIIPNKCGCHIPGAGGMVFGADAASAYAAIVGVASGDVPGMNRVEPGDPMNSYLYHKIADTHTDVGGAGAKMPLGDMLDPGQLETIEQWILDGAQP